MTTWLIKRDDYGVHVTRLVMDGSNVKSAKALTPARSLKLRNHSPTGFEMGYEGSGPAQLALAILLDFGMADDEALAHYQDFKRDFIAREKDFLRIFDHEIQAWYSQRTVRLLADDGASA